MRAAGAVAALGAPELAEVARLAAGPPVAAGALLRDVAARHARVVVVRALPVGVRRRSHRPRKVGRHRAPEAPPLPARFTLDDQGSESDFWISNLGPDRNSNDQPESLRLIASPADKVIAKALDSGHIPKIQSATASHKLETWAPSPPSRAVLILLQRSPVPAGPRAAAWPAAVAAAAAGWLRAR